MIYLRQGYSPEQVSGTLKSVNQDQPSLQVSHEAIYLMPHGGDRRGQIPDMVSIHHRPPNVAERLIPGHWAGDLFKGKGNRSVGMVVERITLFTALAKMDTASAESALRGFGYALNRIEAQKSL